MPEPSTCGISNPFELLSPALGQVAHVLRDRSPLGPKPPFDLHFLGTPQAFVLSQDQTLHEWYSTAFPLRKSSRSLRCHGRLGPWLHNLCLPRETKLSRLPRHLYFHKYALKGLLHVPLFSFQCTSGHRGAHHMAATPPPDKETDNKKPRHHRMAPHEADWSRIPSGSAPLIPTRLPCSAEF